MGLLDDAIREHLDLKRRRGADPTEVERQESEALGPVPRGEGGRALPPEDVDDEPRFDDDAPDASRFDDEAPAPLAAGPVAPPDPAPSEYELDLPEDDDPFVPMDEAPVDIPAADPAEDRTRIVPPPPAADPPVGREVPPTPPGDVDQPTSAYSLDELAALDDRPRAAPPSDTPPPRDVVPADDEPGEHDVLEETPDFLEETPEHDRLWFEQKPPRDFDF